MHPRTGATGHPATTVGEIMTSPVVMVSADSSVGDVADVLRTNRISGAPVVGPDGALLGLVSEYDLLAKSGGSASEVMTTSVISVGPDTAIADVRQLLVERRIRRVPVVDRGKLVGIVSRGDVIALLATEWVCAVCGEAVRGDHAPTSCPRCHAGSEQFSLVVQSPGP